jgi:hypothetical protein
MRRIRFTIAGLLGFVSFTAIGLAALRSATDLWDSGVFGITLALLLISVLLAVHRTGVGRAYWLGFALFGWAYLVICLVPPIEARLPTTQGLAYIDSKVADRPVSMTFGFTTHGVNGNTNRAMRLYSSLVNGDSIVSSQSGTVRVWDATTGRLLAGPSGTSENFVRIGHSLLALVLAFLGAHLSRYLYASGRPGRAAVADAPSPSPAD